MIRTMRQNPGFRAFVLWGALILLIVLAIWVWSKRAKSSQAGTSSGTQPGEYDSGNTVIISESGSQPAQTQTQGTQTSSQPTPVSSQSRPSATPTPATAKAVLPAPIARIVAAPVSVVSHVVNRVTNIAPSSPPPAPVQHVVVNTPVGPAETRQKAAISAAAQRQYRAAANTPTNRLASAKAQTTQRAAITRAAQAQYRAASTPPSAAGRTSRIVGMN